MWPHMATWYAKGFNMPDSAVMPSQKEYKIELTFTKRTTLVVLQIQLIFSLDL